LSNIAYKLRHSVNLPQGKILLYGRPAPGKTHTIPYLASTCPAYDVIITARSPSCSAAYHEPLPACCSGHVVIETSISSHEIAR